MQKTYGIERERFITDADGRIVPAIGTLLPLVRQFAKDGGLSEDRFSFELFAGQIEDRTPPSGNLAEIRQALMQNDIILSKAAGRCGFAFDYSEIVAPDRFTSLEVNPFDARHQQIWRAISPERKVAASIVAAVHVHVSATEEEAIRCLNFCRQDVIEQLIDIGDHSGRGRINAYREMAETDGVPPLFTTFSALMEYIDGKGGERNVWDLVRYKPTTMTVEFRMFGATQSISEVLGYIRACCGVVQLAEDVMVDPCNAMVRREGD